MITCALLSRCSGSLSLITTSWALAGFWARKGVCPWWTVVVPLKNFCPRATVASAHASLNRSCSVVELFQALVLCFYQLQAAAVVVGRSAAESSNGGCEAQAALFQLASLGAVVAHGVGLQRAVLRLVVFGEPSSGIQRRFRRYATLGSGAAVAASAAALALGSFGPQAHLAWCWIGGDAENEAHALGFGLWVVLAFLYAFWVHSRVERALGRSPSSGARRVRRRARAHVLAFALCWGPEVAASALALGPRPADARAKLLALARSALTPLGGFCFAMLAATSDGLWDRLCCVPKVGDGPTGASPSRPTTSAGASRATACCASRRRTRRRPRARRPTAPPTHWCPWCRGPSRCGSRAGVRTSAASSRASSSSIGPSSRRSRPSRRRASAGPRSRASPSSSSSTRGASRPSRNGPRGAARARPRAARGARARRARPAPGPRARATSRTRSAARATASSRVTL